MRYVDTCILLEKVIYDLIKLKEQKKQGENSVYNIIDFVFLDLIFLE